MTSVLPPLAIVVIGAGKGTRMRSSLPKVLHPLVGRPLMAHVLDLACRFTPRQLIAVVGQQAEAVQDLSRQYGATCIVQAEQLGTGHAVAQAEPLLADFAGDVLVLYGDVPLLQVDTVQRLYDEHRRHRAAVTVLTAMLENPYGYGRILRDDRGYIRRIVEERDATEAERAVSEINSGIYCLQATFLFRALDQIVPHNVQGEYYLTDVVGIAVAEGRDVAHVTVADAEEILGVNTRVDLAYLEAILRRRRCEECMLAGVTIVNPVTTVIDAAVSIGQDTVVAPQTHILGRSSLGAGCSIGPQVVIQDSTLGDGVRVEPFCVIRNRAIAPWTTVPAFSNLSSV